MNKLITSFLFITVFLLSACSDDEPQDSVKEIRMLVSAETGVKGESHRVHARQDGR